MEMFGAPSKSIFSIKRHSLNEYIQEFNRQSVIDKLADYLYKDMVIYFFRNYEESEYWISVNELSIIGLTDLHPDDIVEDIKFALSRYFTDDFGVEYKKYGSDRAKQFVAISFNREWNEE